MSVTLWVVWAALVILGAVTILIRELRHDPNGRLWNTHQQLEADLQAIREHIEGGGNED